MNRKHRYGWFIYLFYKHLFQVIILGLVIFSQ